MYLEHDLAKPAVRGIMASASNLYTDNLSLQGESCWDRSSLERKEP
jgi:hypothetical protein